MTKFENKVAVITGGNSGIGYESAKELKALGAKVIISGRNAEKVQTAAQELGVTGVVADVSDLNAIDTLVAGVKKVTDKIDILFVNAGVFAPTPVGMLSEDMYNYTMDINFKGAVFTIEKFIPMLNNGASVINVSSVLSDSGTPMSGIYSASKAALNAYTRTAAVELAKNNIRFNAICPGPISTPIFGKTGMSEEQMNGFAESMLNSIPAKRFGEPQEVAKLVAFLASDDSKFITGSEYRIDGGIGIMQV